MKYLIIYFASILHLFAQSEDSLTNNLININPIKSHCISGEGSPFGISLQYEYLLNNIIKNNRIKDRYGLAFGSLLSFRIYGGYFQYTIYEGEFPDIEQESIGIFIGKMKDIPGNPPYIIVPYYSYMWRDEDEVDGTFMQYGFKVFFIAPGFGISYGFHF